MADWQLKPPLWAALLAVLACAAALGLGTWQLQRSAAKRALMQDYLAAATRPAVAFDAREPAPVRPGAVTMAGAYQPERQLLLDNQSQAERPGYHVWTPLQLDDGTLALVNRGWIPRFADRARATSLPAPAGRVELRGLWRALPRAGLDLPAPPCAPAPHFPHFVIYPQIAELRCLLEAEVADGVLLLDPAAAGGYVREWHYNEAVPPERHMGYAFQWFAIALAILILFLKLNLKRRPAHD